MVRFIFIIYLVLIKQSIGEEVLFENFIKNPEKKWEFITDQVMGGESYGKIQFIKEDDKSFCHLL